MPAPKGNKFAVGKATGRPPTWTPDKIKKEAELLLKWAVTDDAIILREFAGLRLYAPSWLTYLSERSEEFSEALKVARCLVGVRRESLGLKGSLDTGIIKATLATYDEEHKAMLKEMKRAEKEGDVLTNAQSLIQWALKNANTQK